jgi:transposase
MTVTLDRATAIADAGQMADPDPEVPERARRRSFTATYKLEVLAAYDAAGPGEKGAILRREGLYTSRGVAAGPRRGGAGRAGRASWPQAPRSA